MAELIDGKQLSLSLKNAMREEVEQLEARYGRRPCLAVVLVGDNPASQSYVRGKMKASEYVGIRGKEVRLPADCSEQELLRRIRLLNRNPHVDGVLVQLPLPEHISASRVITAISETKDVDGFHPHNVAKLWLGEPGVQPCTPKGIIRLIQSTGQTIEGKRAVIVGRSNIVGKPMAKLLLDQNATVIQAHSHTQNLRDVCAQADILVVAIGSPEFIRQDFIKPGAIVIDVGINRTGEGKLVGDCAFDECSRVAGWMTPVPGGVGPMTITMLMRNTIDCFANRMKS